MAFGWQNDHAGPGSYPSGLKDAELVVRALSVGVDGLNRWSFVNRGDLDGQWQLVDTWDRDRSDVVVSPERQFDVASGSASFRDTIPGLSVSVYTTYNRPHREAGVAAE